MTRTLRRRAWLTGAALVVAGAVLAVLLPTRYGDGGPLARIDGFAVHIPASNGEVFTWGTVLPRNETLDPVRIESIELVNPSSIEIVGLGVNDPDAEGAVGTAHGYPPAGMDIDVAEGREIGPAGGPRP